MRLKVTVLGVICSLLLSACVPDNNNVYYPDNGRVYRPTYDSYGSRYDYEREREQARWERDRQREERERLERERERLEWEREQYTRPPAIHVPRPESCPSGFRLRRSKCSERERRNGCRDSRSSGGGQYCVAGV